MDVNKHYDTLRTEMKAGKSPNARLTIFTAGIAGLVEEHADKPDELKAIGVELRNNSDNWNKLVFETRV